MSTIAKLGQGAISHEIWRANIKIWPNIGTDQRSLACKENLEEYMEEVINLFEEQGLIKGFEYVYDQT
jgi:hypothetical protein